MSERTRKPPTRLIKELQSSAEKLRAAPAESKEHSQNTASPSTPTKAVNAQQRQAPLSAPLSLTTASPATPCSNLASHQLVPKPVPTRTTAQDGSSRAMPGSRDQSDTLVEQALKSGEYVVGVVGQLRKIDENSRKPVKKAKKGQGVIIQAPAVNMVDGLPMPSFSASALMIYNWSPPALSADKFPALSQGRRTEKERLDEKDRSDDVDPDGLGDEWEDFCGDPSLYNLADSRDIHYPIANTFIRRAKRAFWAGKTWAEFASDEEAIDSMSQARREAAEAKDPGRQALILEYALDNRLRLAVFHAISKRLCEEIWLETYTGPASIQPPKRDSKVGSDLQAAIAQSGS